MKRNRHQEESYEPTTQCKPVNTINIETLTQTTPATVEKPMKWNNVDAGPIQCNRFNKAWRAFSTEHTTSVTKSGVIGGEEHEYTSCMLFGGGQRADVLAVQRTIGEKYAWTVTKANVNAILADIAAAFPALIAGRPVNDERRTPEQEAQRTAEFLEVDARRKAEAAARETELQKATGQLRTQYPWAKREGSDHARGASNLKTLLGQRFPGIAFRVKSDSYSGGDSIDVLWADGPTTEEVKTVSDQFSKGRFDGMTDSYDYMPTAFTGYMGGAKHVSESRTVSESIETDVARFLCSKFEMELPAAWQTGMRHTIQLPNGFGSLRDEVNRIIHRTSFPAGAKVIGLEHEHDEGGEFVCKFEIVPVVAPSTTGRTEAIGTNGLVKINEQLNGVEIHFASKPPAEVIARLKANGFRWAMKAKCWYHKQSPYAIKLAHEIAGTDGNQAPATGNSDPAGGYVQAQEDAYQDNIARSIGA